MIQLVDCFILQGIVAVLCVQLLNQGLQLLLLCLHINGVTLEVVVLLLLELMIQLGVKIFDNVVEGSSLLLEVTLL